MRVKKFIPADQVLGVEMVADSTTSVFGWSAETLAKKLGYYGALEAKAVGTNVYAYFETSGDAERAWKHRAMEKSFRYKLNKDVKLIDKVPNFERWYNGLHERDIARMEREKREQNAISCEWDNHNTKKYSRSVETVYDRIVPMSSLYSGGMVD